MAQAQPFPLPISFGRTDAVKNSGGYLINLEAEVAPRDARTPVTIRGTPGLGPFADTTNEITGISQPCVDMLTLNDACYLCTKDAIYRLFPDGGHYKLGTVALGVFGRMETNSLDIVMVDGLRIWSYTIQPDEQSRYDNDVAFTNFAVERTSDPNYYPASTVAFLDGYLIFDRLGTNQFFNTDQYTLAVGGLNFSSAETSPDNVVAVIVDHQILAIFGGKTVEFSYDTGVGDSPFERVPGGLSEHGAASPYAMARINNNIFVLSPEGTVYAYQGYQPRPVSTSAIEDELKRRDLTQATAFCYTDAGHFYYQLTVGDFTAVYDMSTNLWHVRQSYAYGRHRAQCHAFAFGKNLVGDFASGKVFHLSTEYTDDDGDPLIAQIITGPIPTGGRRVGVPCIELPVDVGFGNADVVDPKIGLEMSRDDGKTWGNQRLTSLGRIGKYLTRVRWRRNGDAVDPRFRFMISDAVRRSMPSQCWVEFKQ